MFCLLAVGLIISIAIYTLHIAAKLVDRAPLASLEQTQGGQLFSNKDPKQTIDIQKLAGKIMQKLIFLQLHAHQALINNALYIHNKRIYKERKKVACEYIPA
jgi:hypothetical protein